MRFAQQRASTFVGTNDMDFIVPPSYVLLHAETIAEALVSGVSDHTHQKDSRAWTMWETVCSRYDKIQKFRTAPPKLRTGESPQIYYNSLLYIPTIFSNSFGPFTFSSEFAAPLLLSARCLTNDKVSSRHDVSSAHHICQSQLF